MGSVTVPPFTRHKIIHDPIHGYIPITKIEFEILQLPVLNRLHDLRQLSMAYLVFPGATGSRLAHSLGAMHLASKMIYQLLQSAEASSIQNLFKRESQVTSESGLLQVVQTIRIAALLHDLGHGPFSHATEEFMLAALKSKDVEAETALKRFNLKDIQRLPAHEYYSVAITEKTITESLPELNLLNATALISKEKSPKQEIFTADGLGVFRKIVSSQLDADRMDYLQRDAYFTGVTYGKIDVDRVIMNMCVRQDRKKRFEVAIHERGLAAVEDMLDSRFKMYKWLVSHHMVVALDELLKQAVIRAIESKLLTLSDFYWKTFSSKLTSDSYVFTKLHDLDSANNPFLGLFDRRYLPVSILKRPEHRRAFQSEVAIASGKQIPERVFAEKFKSFVESIREEPVMSVGGQGVLLLATSQTRSPYNPIKPGEVVWVCSDADDTLSDLANKSPYFASINEEWSEFPSYHISYVITGKKKDAASVFRDEVKKKIIDSLV